MRAMRRWKCGDDLHSLTPLPIPIQTSPEAMINQCMHWAAMFEYLLPRSLATPQDVIEYLELHQSAQEFRLEVEHRDHLEAHCQWYYQIAAENRRDLEQMRSEVNLLTLFNRGAI